jgi:hypothetical protein
VVLAQHRLDVVFAASCDGLAQLLLLLLLILLLPLPPPLLPILKQMRTAFQNVKTPQFLTRSATAQFLT